MQPIEDAISQALELLAESRVEEARALLAGASGASRERERERARRLSDARHDIGNSLSIAQASIEAMLDGVVGITDQRLNRIREILAGVTTSMYELTSAEPAGPSTLEAVSTEDPAATTVDALSALAQAKGIRLTYTCTAANLGRFGAPIRSAQSDLLRDVLLNALRFTAKDGSVDVERCEDGGIVVNVDSQVAAGVVSASAGVATLFHDDGACAALRLVQ